ncbi:MAG: beta-propeller domain-containing protein, partial [Anaeromyxobacteraceae bacterium]
VGQGERLTAARFDGARAYVVTARLQDPLYVIDTSDPAAPKVGQNPVHMPGQLEFIEPRGSRLVALGHTNENGPWQLAVSVFDVKDVANPVRTSSATFGDVGSLGVTRDDMRKAFQVLDAAGLVLVPFQGWDWQTYRWSGGLQLLDLDLAAGTVAARGLLEHRGAITRAFPLASAPGLLCAVSDQRLQIVDATRRATPVEAAHLDLARPVIDLAFVNDKAVELSGDFVLGDTALVVTDPLAPDAATPLAEVLLAAPQARLFTVGSTAWLLAQGFGFTGGGAWLQGVDLTTPASPRLAGRLDVTPGAGASLGWPASWGYGDEAAVVGSILAIHRQFWRGPLVAAPGAPSAAPLPPDDEVLLFDLSDADAPRLAGRVALEGSDWAWGLTASGGSLWLTEFTWSEGSANDGRYDLLRIDVSRPNAPRVAAKVNVPGIFLGAGPGDRRVNVLETVWPEAPGPTARSFVRALDLTDHGTARLAASVEIGGWPSGALVDGARAYVATSRWSSTDFATSLAAVDLAAMRVTSSQPLAPDGWASPLRAAGGKLFLTAWARGNVILVYDLADPARPAFEQAVPNPGWVRSVAVRGEYAYLPSGPYGVPMIKLAQ